eukprot:TRINITY_DN20033_c0_g1_i3.p1 TRINITY_DN20033_c0_g1~~TRINITY_DN20033_c0_g1_i3.p1  ORF type:complete len:484 (-),score=3.59 TRINITY_DN20033_c0_g1_i3:276-1565(-)
MDVTVNPANQPGAILAAFMGDGPNLIRAQVWITNNRLRTQGQPGKGARVGLMIFRGAVGVFANNNRIFQFTLAGLQIGYGASNAGDALLNVASNNDIIHDFGQIGAGTDMDVAGIYMGNHWVNPGNVLRCNYVEEGGHCLYLDWCASGVLVDGLVCYKTADGMKLNTGKNNIVKGMIVIDSKEPANGYISCQNYDQNNCNGGYGAKWKEVLERDFQSPAVRKLFPYLPDICKKTAIKGINCNAGTGSQHNAAVTGKCSGLPTENHAQIASVVSPGDKMDRMVFYQDNCKPFPAVPKLNVLRYVKTNTSAAGFISIAKRNFGLTKTSSIRKAFPKFRSCPSKHVGPKRMRFDAYMNLFNIAKPVQRPIFATPMSVGGGASGSLAVASTLSNEEGSGSALGGGSGGAQPLLPNPYARPSAEMIREMELGLQ